MFYYLLLCCWLLEGVCDAFPIERMKSNLRGLGNIQHSLGRAIPWSNGFSTLTRGGPSRVLHQFFPGFPLAATSSGIHGAPGLPSPGGVGLLSIPGAPSGPVPGGSFGSQSFEFYGQEGGGHNYPDKIAYETFFKNPDLKNGIFVEVGAQDGIHRSNTLFFERFLNWKGLLIEGSPVNFEKLQSNVRKVRMNSKAEHSAICETKDLTNFLGDGGTGVDANRMLPGWHEKWSRFWKSTMPVSVNCDRLDSLIERHGFGRVDLMSIDISGAEAVAIRSMDFRRIPVSVIIAECGGGADKDEECRNLLEANGYCMALKVGSNVYYTQDPKHKALCAQTAAQLEAERRAASMARRMASSYRNSMGPSSFGPPGQPSSFQGSLPGQGPFHPPPGPPSAMGAVGGVGPPPHASHVGPSGISGPAPGPPGFPLSPPGIGSHSAGAPPVGGPPPFRFM